MQGHDCECRGGICGIHNLFSHCTWHIVGAIWSCECAIRPADLWSFLGGHGCGHYSSMELQYTLIRFFIGCAGATFVTNQFWCWMLYSECPPDSFFLWSLAHPGPIYTKKDTKTWRCQLSLIILLCTLPGVSAQPMTGYQESNLGWLITSCFCICGLYWIVSIMVKACQNQCNFVLQHRPTKVRCTLRSMGFLLHFATCHFRSMCFD